jgi:thiol-disulfide isomerase/thioredoxin
MKLSFWLSALALISLVNHIHSEATQLNGANFDNVVMQSELVFINFYAGWCRFSNMLDPIWNDFAKRAQAKYNPSQVLVAKVGVLVFKENTEFRLLYFKLIFNFDISIKFLLQYFSLFISS